MEEWTVRRLEADDLAQAYPLVRTVTRVGIERWEEFGRALIAGGGGILVVGAPDGCIYGAAAFRPALDLRYEKTLDVVLLASFALGSDDPVRERLHATLEQVAADEGCRTINVTVAARICADPDSTCRAALERFGLSLETMSFVQRVANVSGEKIDR